MRNGYNKSLFDTEDGICYICGFQGDTARHEVIFKQGRRLLSKKYGLWIDVCPSCHNKIHANDNDKYGYLKEEAQMLFEEEYPELSFLEIFGVNYL